MSTSTVIPLIGDLGTPELLIILAVVVLLFGSSKLPELARGSGRALRIFKAETKGLIDDDDDTPVAKVTPSARPTTAPVDEAATADLDARRADLAARQAEIDAERAQLKDRSTS